VLTLAAKAATAGHSPDLRVHSVWMVPTYTLMSAGGTKRTNSVGRCDVRF